MLRAAFDWREAEAALQKSEAETLTALQLARAERDRATLLLELANAVTSELDLIELIHTISRLMRERVTHHYFSLTLWDAGAGRLRRHTLVFADSKGIIQDGALVAPGSPPEIVFASGRTTVFRWSDVESIGGQVLEVMAAEGLRAVCCVPLVTSRGCHGTINVARPDDTVFADNEVLLLEQVARQLAIAIENALHLERAERFRNEAATGRDRLRLLLAVNNTLVSQLSSEQFPMSVLASLNTAVAHDFASLAVLDRDSGQLRVEAATFYDERGVFEPHTAPPVDETPSGIAFHGRAPRLFSRADLDALGSDAPEVRDTGQQEACSVPLLTARGAIGAFTVARRRANPFTEDEVTLLVEVAKQVAIAVENMVAYREIATLRDRLTEENLYLEDQWTHHDDVTGIVGSSAALRAVVNQVRTVAPTDATVLLLGETGTGKEVLARAIHNGSRRRQQTFVRINAASLPATLVESELFGYEKGAFTGAATGKAGRVELAHRGTLFLDEIGDMPLDVQPKLLRLLQEHEFERLGGTRTLNVDVRLIAATNRPLPQMVEAGTFRSDLYYRLSVFPIHVPPVRERTEDIPALVWHFVRRFSSEMGRSITAIAASTMDRLVAWPWPGNIREIQNVVERAVILSTGHTLEVPESAFHHGPRAHVTLTPIGSYSEGERSMILRALRESGGVIAGPTGAAARLGIKRTTLNSKMRKLGIARPSF